MKIALLALVYGWFGGLAAVIMYFEIKDFIKTLKRK